MRALGALAFCVVSGVLSYTCRVMFIMYVSCGMPPREGGRDLLLVQIAGCHIYVGGGDVGVCVRVSLFSVDPSRLFWHSAGYNNSSILCTVYT